MNHPSDPRDLDALAERYAFYLRIRNDTRTHAPFGVFCQSPGLCERLAMDRIRDWRQNTRLVLGVSIHLN